MPTLDPRRVRLTLTIDSVTKTFEGLSIESTGTKCSSAVSNQATVKVYNLTKSDRDYLLTKLGPYSKDKTQRTCVLEAGRDSTGLSQIFAADVTACSPTAPPDVALTLKAQAGAFHRGVIVSTTQPGSAKLSTIAARVASDNGLTLDFEATNDPQISNFSFTGAASKELLKLEELGTLDVYEDDGVLIVKDRGAALANRVRVLSPESGMIGIPQATEQGIRVTYLLDNTSRVGSTLRIKSTLNSSLNGDYTIYKLSWNISSRSTPFYWIAEAKR